MNALRILILFLFASIQILGQTHDINHKKYWIYRSRLVNDFMKIGNGLGESLPASHRAKSDKRGPVMYFGADAVSQLGEYISVLTTEYALLKNSGQSADSTVRELYYALEAFNRLDYNAEALWGKPNDLNGFFIRQDLPCGFIKDNIYHFDYDLNFVNQNALPNYSSPSYVPGWTDNGDPDHPEYNFLEYGPYGGFISHSYENRINYGDPGGEEYCDWLNAPTAQNSEKLAMSLDQTAFMFIGCALINKFVDENVTYKIGGYSQYFLDGEVSIRNEARRISNRMLSTLQGNGNWHIKMPNGNEVSNAGGGVAWEYSFPFSDADCKIQKSNTPVHSDSPCFASGDLLSSIGGYPTWTAISSDAGVIADVAHPDNAPKTMELSVACNCDYIINVTQILINIIYTTIEYVIGWIHHWVNGDPKPVYGWSTTIGNETETRIENRAGLFNLQWGPLLRKVLHGGGNLSYNTYDYGTLLNDAPCTGPLFYSQFDSDLPNYPWASVDNLEHPGDANDAFVDNSDKRKGEFNGLDYMLYHNAYYLDNPSYYVGAYDQRYRELYTLNYPFVTSSFQIGNNTHPVLIRAYEYITASNSILASVPTDPSNPSNGNATYEAGKNVHLLPGFHAQSGANFHAYVQRPECSSSNEPLRTANNSASITNEGLIDYNQPTEFVNYPSSQPEYEASIINQPRPANNVKPKLIQNGAPMLTDGFELMEVVPNPNAGQFTVKLNTQSLSSLASFDIIDVVGNKVYNNNKVGDVFEIPVNLEGLSKGVYMIRAKTEKGNLLTKKFIVQ